MKRLTSELTRYYKRILPIAWLLVFGSLALSPLLEGGYGSSRMTPAAILAFLMLLLGLAYWRFLAGFADEVMDTGGALIVCIGEEQEHIPLSNIDKVSFNALINPPVATLELRRPGKFGSRILFTPLRGPFSPRWGNPMVEELRERVASARMKGQASG